MFPAISRIVGMTGERSGGQRTVLSFALVCVITRGLLLCALAKPPHIAFSISQWEECTLVSKKTPLKVFSGVSILRTNQDLFSFFVFHLFLQIS